MAGSKRGMGWRVAKLMAREVLDERGAALEATPPVASRQSRNDDPQYRVHTGKPNLLTQAGLQQQPPSG